MHLIERIFHVAPDGGSGALELELELLLAFLLFALTFAAIRKMRTKRGPR